jgi:hypothetical protein
MANQDGALATALVISDDDEQGGLLALNLRRRQVSVEQTDFRLASSSRWLPANGRPGVVIINLENSRTDPFNATGVIARLGRTAPMIATKLGDVGGIVAAALTFLPIPVNRR